jgi:hypothetical protein
MPRKGDMDYLREVAAFADFIVEGQLVGETTEQAQRRLEVRAFIKGIGGAVNDTTMDALNAYVRGEITSADLAARIKVWPLLQCFVAHQQGQSEPARARSVSFDGSIC